MPTQRQIVVQQPVPPDKKFGASSYSNSKKIFPASPIHAGEVSDEERKKVFQELVVDGIVVGGNGLNTFDPNYVDAPNLDDVKTGGAGLPATPFTPNLTSPGPGSLNASDQPVYEGDLLGNSNLSTPEFGTGLGGTVSPSKTSKDIARQSVLSDYIMGRSYPGSDGKSS